MGWLRRRRWGAAESEAALPGIAAVPWDSLQADTGRPAVKVPALLVSLVLDEGRKDLRDRLGGELGASTRFWAPVTPHAVPFLLRVAQDQGHPRGAWIAQVLLSELVYGEWFGDDPTLPARMAAAFEAGRPFYEELLRTGDRSDKAMAIETLAGMNGRTDRLRNMLANLDVDPALDRSDPLIAEALETAHRYYDDT